MKEFWYPFSYRLSWSTGHINPGEQLDARIHRIAFYQSLQSEYTPLLFSAQGLQLNVLQWLIKCWTEPAMTERTYSWGVYGDCIGFNGTILWKEPVLWKEPANTYMVELVFRGLNVGWLGIFLIKAPKFNGCDSIRLDLGKRLPLRPNGTFSVIKFTQRKQLQ
jgi:hypothetical protein